MAHAYIAWSDETGIVDCSYQIESAVVGIYLATLEIEVSLLGYLVVVYAVRQSQEMVAVAQTSRQDCF